MKLLLRNGKVIRINDGSLAALEEDRLPVQEQIDELEEQVETEYVPFRLAKLPTIVGFRQSGSVYVDDGQKGFRMSLADIKDLNTKIITTNSADNVDMTKLTIDDFIYERNDK